MIYYYLHYNSTQRPLPGLLCAGHCTEYTATHSSTNLKFGLQDSRPILSRYFIAQCVHFYHSKGHFPNSNNVFLRFTSFLAPLPPRPGHSPAMSTATGARRLRQLTARWWRVLWSQGHASYYKHQDNVNWILTKQHNQAKEQRRPLILYDSLTFSWKIKAEAAALHEKKYSEVQ